MDSISHAENRLQLMRDVEELLTCKVCCQRIRPPVVVCRKGHCICKGCKSTGFMCPLCNKFLITDRFVMLENILNAIPRLCKYHDYGCNMIIPWDSQHDQYCFSRPKKCELGLDTSCSWTGSYNDWLDHVRCNDHRQFIFTNPSGDNFMFVQIYDFLAEWEVYNIFLQFGSCIFVLFFFKSEEFLHLSVKYMGQIPKYVIQMPKYSVKVYFLKSFIESFTVKLDSKDDKIARCEDIPLDELLPLANEYQELDMYVELLVDDDLHLLDLGVV